MQDSLYTHRCPVKPDRIILPSADSTPQPLFVDLGFTTAAETHFAMSDSFYAAHSRKRLLHKSLFCVGLHFLSKCYLPSGS